MTYLWQKPAWPSFNWSSSAVLELLVTARFEQGRLLSIGSSFVHSFEISESKSSLYFDLIAPGNEGATLNRIAGWQKSLKKSHHGGFRTKELARPSLPAKELPEEMRKYLNWWTEPPVGLDPVIRAAVAFFWFMLISPFESGNFELACALSELALQESERSPTRLYDISLQLSENKNALLQAIDIRAAADGDITEWILLFLQNYISASRSAISIADKITAADRFWKKYSACDLNARQRKILNRLLENDRPVTNRECVDLCNTSRESTKRDLAELVKLGILMTGDKKGRSVNYSLL